MNDSKMAGYVYILCTLSYALCLNDSCKPTRATGGGPLFSTCVYNLNLYEKAFQWLQMGLAAAMAWLLFVIILGLTMLVFRGSDAYVYYEVKQ